MKKLTDDQEIVWNRLKYGVNTTVHSILNYAGTGTCNVFSFHKALDNMAFDITINNLPPNTNYRISDTCVVFEYPPAESDVVTIVAYTEN